MSGCGGEGHSDGQEHSDHSHSHGTSDASDVENLKGHGFNLYLNIKMDSLTCLNEADEGSGKLVFRSYEDRLNREKFVVSDVDEELLFNIPFTGVVKLKGIIVIGGERETHPRKMKLFKNRPNMSFDDTYAKPDQEFDVHVDQEGSIEYKPIIARFSDVQHMSIHFPCNHGDTEKTEIYYIGLKGDHMEARRQEVLITAYEAQPNPADHKTKTLNQVNQMIS